MRIIAGEFRGRRLLGPRDNTIRPTSDRVREALFSTLAGRVPGARVLDLFAGSGALGLEALSRGARRVLFVDHGAEALRLLRANIVACRAEDRCRVLRGTLPQVLERAAVGPPDWDLVFMDPPYGLAMVDRVLPVLGRLLVPGALLVVEQRRTDAITVADTLWRLEAERGYGDTKISYLMRVRDES